MDGIICVYKPSGYTSFDAVAIVRKIFKTKKVGHGGTLDPMAEGVLPIFLGNATRAVDFQPDNDKEYVAGFRFGVVTDTQDITGKVTATSNEYVSRNKMIFVERYKGEIEQIPPMYSAVHVDGERLYDIARRGEVVERQPRKVTINSLKVEHYADNEGVMRVNCSKGTYIRTLIHDIGQDLGVGAVMTSLLRTKSGIFTIEDCHQIDDLRKLASENGTEYMRGLLMPLDKLFADYAKANLDDTQTMLFNNGAKLAADRVRLSKIYSGTYAVYSDEKVLIALAKIAPDRTLQVVQRFRAPEITDDLNNINSERENSELDE
jgi:tRNA pseudouridine55 synthase